MAKFNDISNKKFGRLTAINLSFRDEHQQAHWLCFCECGTRKSVNLRALTSGATKSCGCLNQEVRVLTHTGNKHAETHGLSKHPLYQVWATMLQRCLNPNHVKFEHYGLRGINVCERWENSFPNFLKDMGERPNKLTLERRNNNLGYSPDNCYWASFSDQNRNRRSYRRRNKETGLFNEI